MAIDPEVLNHKVRDSGTIRPGVFLSDMRNVAVVVRVKEGKVTFLTWHTGTVRIEVEFTYTFARNWPLSLPNYPVRRALKRFARGGLPLDPGAAAVIRTVLG